MPPRTYNHILCIRPDNMGDIIMSGPAIRALKKTFGARITLLASQQGSGIVPFLPEIDEVITADLPWVKTQAEFSPLAFRNLTDRLHSMNIDLAVIFTVYSQNPLPAALLCWQAGIPARAAYCRENPYHLLTTWIPDEEPYSFIRHQVQRDLQLVRQIGAETTDDTLQLTYSRGAVQRAIQAIGQCGVDTTRSWIVLHPGVSDAVREYPLNGWIEAAKLLRRRTGLQLLVTGGPKEAALAGILCEGAGEGVHVIAGRLSIEEFIALIAQTLLVISVNTVTAHIAAATGTPVIVLYALTNPQHTPWKARSEVLPFSIPESSWSRNEVIRHVNLQWRPEAAIPTPLQIVEAAEKMLQERFMM